MLHYARHFSDTTLGPSGTPPPARAYHAATYDPGSNRLTVYGGSNGATSFLNDVWVLTNANGTGGTPTWTQLVLAGSAPAVRYLHTAVYDENLNAMTIFGGWDASSAFGDLWVLADANGVGTPSWTQVFAGGTNPTARGRHTAVYDGGSGRMMMFGGDDRITGTNNGSVLENAATTSSNWIIALPALPLPRLAHSAVYSPLSKRMIVFGGNENNVLVNDVWVLTNANGQS